MTNLENAGSQDHTLQSQVNPRVFKVVTELNKKVKYLKNTVGNYGLIREISPEEMRWIQAFVETGDITKASQIAYSHRIKNKNHARNLGLVKMQKPMITKAISDIMDTNEKLQTPAVMEQYTKLLYSDNEMVSKDMIKEYFKIKGAYAPEKHIGFNANANYEGLSDDELTEQVNLFIEDSGNGGEEETLDEIALRDGEEVRPPKF